MTLLEKKFTDITKPALLINKSRVLKNIHKMAGKAKQAGVFFRPHFKTHQSAEIGDWFQEAGVTGITVSSVEMARYFADNGWRDITIAIPVNIREIEAINQLNDHVELGLLVDSLTSLDFLAENLEKPAAVWIKVDAGYGRAGIPWNQFDELLCLAEKGASYSKLQMAGILTHSGHTYKSTSLQEIHLIYKETISRMLTVKNMLEEKGLKNYRISIGDTPSCSLEEHFEHVDEIRPGNFVFYDLMMHQLGVCKEKEMALGVVCPVIGKYPLRNEILIYGGGIHFSKEFLLNNEGRQVYGYLTEIHENDFTGIQYGSPLISLSQEHGVIQLPDEKTKNLNIGDLVVIYPVHACLTAHLHQQYWTFDSESIERF